MKYVSHHTVLNSSERVKNDPMQYYHYHNAQWSLVRLSYDVNGKGHSYWSNICEETLFTGLRKEVETEIARLGLTRVSDHGMRCDGEVKFPRNNCHPICDICKHENNEK